MPRVVARLQAVFPRARVCLKYLPPGTSTEWLRTAPGIGKRCICRPHVRPVMTLDPGAMDCQRRKKNHRQNYNRLSRLGTVRFARVTEFARFTRVLDEICLQYDLRQAILYHRMPFSSDPLKKRFYRELHERGLLHTTVLTVEDDIVASHMGLSSKGSAVHLGINTHAPAYAAHSPGNLLLAMLGVQLAQENVGTFDLTPGGDAYKEHFASEHDQVWELTIFGRAIEQLQARATWRIRRLLKVCLRVAGWRSRDVLALLDMARRLGRPEPRRWLERLRPRAWRLWRCQVLPLPAQGNADRLRISRNCLEDVFKFDGDGSWTRRSRFLGMVMKRLERSCRLYSFVAEGKLMICCWSHARVPGAPGRVPERRAVDAGAAVVLFDLYVHRQLSDARLVQRFIEQVSAEIGAAAGSATLYYRGSPAGTTRDVLQRCGFSEVRRDPRGMPPYMQVGSLRKGENDAFH
jgi:hypothetical protein